MSDVGSSTRVSKRTISDALANLDQSISTSTATTTTAKKKRRTVASTSTSTPALEAILARSSPRRSTPSLAPPPPSYEPTSLPALLSRLSTYRLTTFSPSKPSSLSPLNCALHGWINKSSRERLECVTCRKGIVLLPPSNNNNNDWQSRGGISLKLEYEKLVLDQGKGHENTCPWRMRPCSKSLYRLQQGGARRKLLETVGNQAKEMAQLGLGGIELELPLSVKDLLEQDGAKDKLVKSVTSLLSRPDDDTLTITTLLLSIFGWSLDPLPSYSSQSLSRSISSSSSISSLKSTCPILSCSYCLRQVITSSYLPSSATTAPKLFNPASQHYNYCPYVDITTTTTTTTSDVSVSVTSPLNQGLITTKKKPGYQIRLETILQKNSTTMSSSSSNNPLMNLNTLIRGGEGGKNDSTTSSGTGEGVVGIGKSNIVKTRELLNYVRGLLGPKTTLSSPLTK